MSEKSWFAYLKRGLSCERTEDRLADPSGKSDARKNLRNLRPFLVRHWRSGVLGALLILATGLLGFPQPLLNRSLIDDAILGRRLDTLVTVVLLMIGIEVLGMVMGVLQQWYFTRFGQNVNLDIRQDLLRHTLRLPKSFFDEQEVGYLMSRLTGDVAGVNWFFSTAIVQIISNALQLVGGLILLFYLEWRLALVVLILLPGLLVWSRFFSPRMRALSHRGMERSAHVMRRMQESLSSTALIKSFASEEREVGQFTTALRSSFDVSLEQTALGSVAGVSLTVLNKAANLTVLAAGAFLVISGQWTLGSLVAFRSYVGYVYGPARFLANVNIQWQNALAALERVSTLYNIVPEETGVGIPAERLTGEIEFRDVSFSYTDGQPVLQNVSFHVRPGERVAIIGPSGVGKTTLVSLLLRFYRPSSGEIWFDGRPASDYELRSLRQRIGYVSQAPLLLSGTVNDNLRYGNPDAGVQQVEQASRASGIHNFVVGLPDGYESQVGERGINFSEGQKQRLSLARALIKDPDILVLDEPSSALDSLTERSIFEALPAIVRGKTLFVVAHRLSTVRDSACILLLNENRLVALGTHESLLAENELYRSMVARQRIG